MLNCGIHEASSVPDVIKIKWRTHHTDEDVAAVPEGGEDVVHELLVPEPPLGLVVGGVVAVSDQQAGPR